jgi:hypothetical protein
MAPRTRPDQREYLIEDSLRAVARRQSLHLFSIRGGWQILDEAGTVLRLCGTLQEAAHYLRPDRFRHRLSEDEQRRSTAH